MDVLNQADRVDEAIDLEELAQRAADGSLDARESLLRQLQDVIYRFCCSQLHRGELATEATQETALRVLTHLASFRKQSSVRTWALGIALNVCRETRRRVRPGTTDLLDAAEASLEEPYLVASRQEELDRLYEALQVLTERQRESLVLRYFERLSTEQTAEVMGVAVGTVKATTAQAIQKLRGSLGVENSQG